MALPFELPRVALGTGPLGSMVRTFGYAVSDDDAHNTIQHALEAGVTMIDTAPFYGNGVAETRVGHVLRGIPRDRYLLSTKVGWLVHEVGKLGAGERTYSRDSILRSIEASQKRLGIDVFDMAHIHDPENGDYRREIMEEGYPTLLELKQQGVIRGVGAGLNQTAYLTDYAQHAPLDVALLANRYTLLEQEPMETAFPLAMKNDIRLMVGGVFNSGILATGGVPGARYYYQPAPEPVRRLTRLIESVCATHGVSLKAAAMQFVAAHPAVSTLVLGMAKPAEIDENLAALNAPIPTAFWAELKTRGLIEAGAPTP
jgi:D-threo-aldose 1-dehydrogenase